MKKFIKKLNTYSIYTIIFIILCIFVFFSFIKNGRSFIWQNNVINMNSPQIYTILIIIEIFCAGLSFITYCTYHKKGKFATIIGSLIYTFNGFFLYAVLRNPLLAIPTIWLPLMFLCIDRIFKKDKYITFIIMSAISTVPSILNIYPLYIITILTFIYAIIKYFNEYKHNDKKTFCLKFLKIFICYIIGVLATFLLLLHTANIFKNLSFNIDLSFTYYDFNYYLKSLFMSLNTAYWSKSYIAPLVLTVLPIAILNFKKNKENRTFLITLLTLAIIFFIPPLSYMMNGFCFETIKWSFAFNFILAYIVTINIRSDLIYSPKEFKFVKKCLVIYLILWFLFRSHVGNFALTSILFAFAYLVILVARSLDYAELKKNQQFEYAENLKGPNSSIIKYRIKIVLLLALCLNIIFFSWQLFYHLKYAKEFTKYENIKINVSDIVDLNNIDYIPVKFEFGGKNIKKILAGNKLKITKKRKSIKLKITDIYPENCKIYVSISNLKYLKNNQYSVTAKYNEISQKQIIRDKVKTPSYIKNDNIVFYLGNYDKNLNTIKLTFSNTGSYEFDEIKLIAIPN